ncbi:restriction endonuclease subunit S [Solidesulfovibrio magneticus]|uniref:Uncharacterized protein n=1 Tax=Solidesulfovibrio magneticus (strain ATCC 700980 / DSM 13731 / RS-1) TaxID=573370 RepID=C4XNH5_SOLM1|nr:restriction endonuclease subunit S [Solidesulfovibrio magneticus]BAH74950.1 hypothetical protein DMR_14590 [Solidesulfovibrio magneticus RS-1]
METKLGEVADVIRCQLPRTRTGGKDGWILCREVTQADFEPISGIVSGGSGDIWVELDPSGKQKKYLIRNNDVLFSFRGTGETLGQAGLYIGQNEERVVCGQSLCIIRPKAIDGLWLYYFMRRRAARESLLAKSCGNRLMTINLNDLRDVLVEMSSDEEVDKIHAKHKRISSIYTEIQELSAEMIRLME